LVALHVGIHAASRKKNNCLKSERTDKPAVPAIHKWGIYDANNRLATSAPTDSNGVNREVKKVCFLGNVIIVNTKKNSPHKSILPAWDGSDVSPKN
jgi:hypothetical protein